MRLLEIIWLVILLPLPAWAETKEITVTAYNVENYAVSERRDEAGTVKLARKSDKSIAALIDIIKSINPDVLGVSEMGRREDFADFRRRLAKAGLRYRHFEFVEAADANRHLALVSRYPIIGRQSMTDVTYELNGVPQKVRRGFLDVTIRINAEYQLRLVGAHLKSRLPAPEGEALLRRNEAHLLRRHIEEILAEDPQVNLLVYGDFNASKNEPVIQELMGEYGSPAHLTPLPLSDNVGDRWTHHWKVADAYSRIDFLFASPGLLMEVRQERSGVHRSDDWFIASDHRAITTKIVPENKTKRHPPTSARASAASGVLK